MKTNPTSAMCIHGILLVLGIAFVLPFAWLVASSLQPREQINEIPPRWLPRMYRIEQDGRPIDVTPPEVIATPHVLVRPLDGPDKGKPILLPMDKFHDGRITQTIRVADRLEQKQFPATRVQTVPAGWVRVQSWHLSKYENRTPGVFYVPQDAVTRHFKPVWGNYPEAIRQLTAGEEDKQLGGLSLLKKTRFVWSHAETPRTVTFLTYLSNTIIIAVLGVAGTVLSSSLVAYGMARIPFKGRGCLWILTLSTMMIPFPVVMIPLYAVFRHLGWIGTLKPLWVPAFFGSAFNIFLLRQFFLTIPQDLSDAARMDGCSEFGIYRRIVMPLSKPALTVVALFHFLYAWNDFLGPLLFLTKPETFTLSLGLQQYQSQHGGSEWHLLMAASCLLVLPIVVLFFFAQKTFIQGIATTGMKG